MKDNEFKAHRPLGKLMEERREQSEKLNKEIKEIIEKARKYLKVKEQLKEARAIVELESLKINNEQEELVKLKISGEITEEEFIEKALQLSKREILNLRDS